MVATFCLVLSFLEDDFEAETLRDDLQLYYMGLLQSYVGRVLKLRLSKPAGSNKILWEVKNVPPRAAIIFYKHLVSLAAKFPTTASTHTEVTAQHPIQLVELRIMDEDLLRRVLGEQNCVVVGGLPLHHASTAGDPHAMREKAFIEAHADAPFLVRVHLGRAFIQVEGWITVVNRANIVINP